MAGFISWEESNRN